MKYEHIILIETIPFDKQAHKISITQIFHNLVVTSTQDRRKYQTNMRKPVPEGLKGTIS